MKDLTKEIEECIATYDNCFECPFSDCKFDGVTQSEIESQDRRDEAYISATIVITDCSYIIDAYASYRNKRRRRKGN